MIAKKKPFAKKSFEFCVFSQKRMEWKKMAFGKRILRRDVNFGIFFLFTPTHVMDEFQWAFFYHSLTRFGYIFFRSCCVNVSKHLRHCQAWY